MAQVIDTNWNGPKEAQPVMMVDSAGNLASSSTVVIASAFFLVSAPAALDFDPARETYSPPVGATGITFDIAADASISYCLDENGLGDLSGLPVVTRAGSDLRRVFQPLGTDNDLYITALSGVVIGQWL